MISPRAFAYVQELTRAVSGVVIAMGKEYLVESRLAPVAAAAGVGSVEQLITTLMQQPLGASHREVVEAMTTNQTSFFRDHAPFEVLRTQVLPELIENRSAARPLRICSAASSTGQEAYSLAMLLLDRFPELVARGEVQIFALDIDSAALERAASGVYRVDEVNRGLPARYLTRYFHRRGLDWQVTAAVRQLVCFEQCNLVTDTLPPSLDLVLLRNVLMYFDEATRLQVLHAVHRSLAAHGVLFVGATETLFAATAFARTTRGRATFYRPQPPVAEVR